MPNTIRLHRVIAKNLRPVLNEQIKDATQTHLMTDGESQYRIVAPMFASHDVVNHGAGECLRGDAYTNTVEGYFSVLKRCIVGTFHQVSPLHLQRYLMECDFRYNHCETRMKVNGKWERAGFIDTERATMIAKDAGSKRLAYRRVDSAA